MTRMARRLRAALASFLAASLVVLSPGLEAPRLFAQVIGRAAPVEGVRAVPGLTGGAVAAAPAFAPALAARAFAAPSLSAAPAAAAPALAPAVRAASIPEMAKTLAPQIEAAAKPTTSASGAAAAGRGIEDVITGRRSAGSGEMSAVAGSESAAAPSLGFSAAASAPTESPKSGVPAAGAPAEGKTVASETSYRVHRFLLNAVAALTGAVNSLPAAGPALTRKLIASAADKRVVLSDYDDTLAGYNQVLPEDMVQAITAVKAAGKDFVVISDRGDEKRAHQLTVFESLASLPAETRAGMYVAANSGGRVYRYDEIGEPVRVFEAPALDEASKAKVGEAAEATKARLKEIGAEQHFPSEGNNNPAESWGTYGYALMLKVGSGNEAVKGAAAILQEELGKRGMDVEVNPRFAKDPANPPYINFSIVTKAGSAAYIAKALKAEPKDVLVIGDSMYAPKDAKKASWLARWGETLSGREMPKTGNRTDANMERGVLGALTLSVGTTGDPRASNLWVLAGKGPSVTRQVLMSVASKSSSDHAPRRDIGGTVLAIAAAVSLAAFAATAFYSMYHAFAEIIRLGEQQMMQHGRDFMDGAVMFGGTLGLFGRRAKTGGDKASRGAAASRLKRILAGVGLFGLTAAIYGGLYYAASHAPAAVSSVPTAPGGWEMLFGGTLAGLGLGVKKDAPAKAWTLKQSISPASPVDGFETFVYETALEAARGMAVKAGYNPENLRLTGAKLEPRAWGEDWAFSFVSLREGYDKAPRAYELKVRRTMVAETQLDAYDLKDLGASGMPANFPASLVSETIKVAPMAVVAKSGDDARTLELRARWSAAGPAELVYVIRGENGRELKSVNAATGAETAPQPWAKAKAAAATLALIAATAALYAAIAYAFMHAPAATSGLQVPEGWQGPIPSNVDIGAVFGGMLGVVGLSGAIKKVKGQAPKISDERVTGAANSVISYKGRPWSNTEYNMAYYTTLESLKKAGATPAQVALFEKLCADAPIRGGSFNPWSGD